MKDKAKELVKKFRFYQPHNLRIAMTANIESRQYAAKESAKLCVDEMMGVIPKDIDPLTYMKILSELQQVKQEIQKL